MRGRHHRVLGVDRRSAREMEIPHSRLLALSPYCCFSAFSAGVITRGPRWHIHAALGNGGRRIAQYQSRPMIDFCGFPHPTPPDKPPPMPCQVAAFYQFTALPHFRKLREPLRAICADLKLKGSVLLADEGINGTLAGSAEARLPRWLRNCNLAPCSAAGSIISS